MKNWIELYQLGVDVLDQDHRKLLRVAEQIAEKVDDPDTDPKKFPFWVREGLKYMGGYYQAHIEREEAYMRQIGYAHYDLHKQVHDEMRETITAYIDSRITIEHCEKKDVLELLGATYGWQMIHIATEDLDILHKGTMARPPMVYTGEESVTKELDTMLTDLIGKEARTKILNANYRGDGTSTVACQQVVYVIDGQEVDVFLGADVAFLRNLTEVFWAHKVKKQELDEAHTILLQWCLTSFTIGFWRDLIERLTHGKSCRLKKVTPLEIQNTEKAMAGKEFKRSVLYDTSLGRFFFSCNYCA
jgi:hemerythrin